MLMFKNGCARVLKTHKILTALALMVAVSAQAAEPDLKAGAQMYKAVCGGCHGVSIAPSLRGLIDRPIASEASFPGYSDALKAKQGESWTIENLNLFLKDPQAFAAGTLMVQAITDDQERANMIAFLKTLPPPRR